MRLKGIIFDFDGTLAELKIDFALLREELKNLARDAGYQSPWPNSYVLEEVEEVAAELGDSYLQKAMTHIQTRELEASAQGSLFPYTLPLMQAAKAKGLVLAIITRNCDAAVRQVMPQIDELCHAFLPREATPRPKPHPAHVDAALKAMGLTGPQTALVGDHPLDVKSGQHAGCYTVGVATGRMTTQDLQKAGADLVLPDASKLLDALK